MTDEYADIDGYIALFDGEAAAKLKEIREIVHAAVPEATEKIAWNMPTFVQDGYVVHFAAGKNHLGLYPGASGVAQFLSELGEYKTSKGAIQFPFGKPLPRELIARIAAFRAAQNAQVKAEKEAAKQAAKEAKRAAKKAASGS